jgi:phosphoserine phosphatase
MLFLVCAYFFHKTSLVSVTTLHTLAFKVLFFGKKKSLIDAALTDFFAQNNATLYRKELVEKLKKAQNEGALVWIQSSSPDCLVERVANYFLVKHVTATRYGVDEQEKYSHIVEVVDGETKKMRLEEFLKNNVLTFGDVSAYSDSALDLPLLYAVGIPVAVCPDKTLEKIAKRNSWQVMYL